LTVNVYSVSGARPTSFTDVSPVQRRFPSCGLTDTWYSAMPVSSVDASQASEISEAVTESILWFPGADGGVKSGSVFTMSRLLASCRT
jgi:hypothetical protein